MLNVQVVSPSLEEAIRGFRVVRNATQELVFDKPGDYLIPEPAAAAEAPAQQVAQSDDTLDMEGAAPPAAAGQETVVPVGSAGGSVAGEPSEGGNAEVEAVAVGAGANIFGS
jgi:hypothetical protein